MPGRLPAPVLIAYRDAPMRRIIGLNLEWEDLPAVEIESTGACRAWLSRRDAAAVLLDARLLDPLDEVVRVRAALRQAGVPVLVVADGPEYRPLARLLDDAPFWCRPDDVDGLIRALRPLLTGIPVPV